MLCMLHIAMGQLICHYRHEKKMEAGQLRTIYRFISQLIMTSMNPPQLLYKLFLLSKEHCVKISATMHYISIIWQATVLYSIDSAVYSPKCIVLSLMQQPNTLLPPLKFHHLIYYYKHQFYARILFQLTFLSVHNYCILLILCSFCFFLLLFRSILVLACIILLFCVSIAIAKKYYRKKKQLAKSFKKLDFFQKSSKLYRWMHGLMYWLH